jgi:site-specific DNA-methyltransferase (adenine-specific)
VSRLRQVLGLDGAKPSDLRAFAERTGIPLARLRIYLDQEILPPSPDLETLCASAGISTTAVKLALGKIDREVATRLANKYAQIAEMIDEPESTPSCKQPLVFTPEFETQLGRVFRGDCVQVMKALQAESVDMVFADPPFNLNKLYPSRMDDDLREGEYLDWTEEWLTQCVRLLRPGGALLVWNIPKWSSHIAAFLNRSLSFRHWIAVDIKYSLPISGRLYPSHYSLLYFTKGAPKTFHPDRLPMEICPHCYGDLRDYGGYKDKMNPKGVNMSDVWFDIPPVRHAKYKRRKDANELSLRLMDRVVEMGSDPGDIVLDPFAGSGTTLIASELKQRRWIGIELGPIEGIVDRLQNTEEEEAHLSKIRADYNTLFTARSRHYREKLGLWTCESVRTQDVPLSEQASLQLDTSSNTVVDH